MNYITDYQLEKEGFQCKVNDKIFDCPFKYSSNKKQYYISNILKVADAIGVDRTEFVGIFGSQYVYNVIFCPSKVLCYELCQHIVKTYFKPFELKCIQSSREHLKHYYHGTEQVNFPNGTFILKLFNPIGYFWSGANPIILSKDLYQQFELSTNQVLKICNNLKLLACFSSNILVFCNREDAIKFTDYLIETYIIKKEKTYDTNRLRKERTSLSRGAKPAGSIIHGRRGKASVRCGHLEHKARVGC